MKIYLGADHRGFNLKEKIVQSLKENGFLVDDLGVDSAEPADYPIIAEKVARQVAKNPPDRGILVCGSGEGVCIAANKVNGIRAGLAFEPRQAEKAREDEDINVLCLGADDLDFKKARAIIETFLKTDFKKLKRYQRRISQIKKIEK